MAAVNELLLRGTGPYKTAGSIDHVTNGTSRSLHLDRSPMQEIWWFTDAGTLVLMSGGRSDIASRGLTVKPGSPAVIRQHDYTGQQDVLGAHPLAARLVAWSKDSVIIGRLQAFSEEGSIDLAIDITPTGTDPVVTLASYAGQAHDITAVHTAFDDPLRANLPRNAVLDDGSRAWAEPPTLQKTAEASIELDPRFALIDAMYSHYDGSGNAGLMARLNGGSMQWLTCTNTVAPNRIDKNGYNSNSGAGNIRLLEDSHVAYGRMTCAQMYKGTWQCWLRAHSEDHRFCEAMFIVTPPSTTVHSELAFNSGHANTAAFVHTVKKYLK